jgi:hypothetical protein
MKHIVLLFAQILMLQLAGIQNAKAQNDEYSKSCFYKAKEVLDSMLSGKTKATYEKAVFVTENAYWGNRERYNSFDSVINYHVRKIKALVENLIANDTSKARVKYLTDSKAEKEAEHERLQKNCAIYKYMTSPLFYVYGNKFECHIPYDYSKKDPYGTTLWQNTQVLNLLTEQQGNCYALASLYKIFSDKLQTDAVIAITSGHAFIQHQDDKGLTYNIELASHAFPGSGSIETLTYTTEKAVKSGIAMRSLDEKQSINLCLIYLAKGFENKFKASDNDFSLSCAELALKYDSLNLNAMLLKAEVLETRLLNQHKQVPELKNWSLFMEYQSLVKHIYNLGYREMPTEMQNILLSRIKQDDYGTIVNHTPRPFKDLNVKNPRYATLSGGVFNEEIHDKPIEKYHRTLFDTKSQKITAFASIDSTYDNYVTDPVVFAWSIDPHNGVYPCLSPYNGMGDDPINGLDIGGKLIIFINGFYWGDNHKDDSYLKLQKYWDVIPDYAAGMFGDNEALFYNGSQGLNTKGSQGDAAAANSRVNAGQAMGYKEALYIKGLLDEERKTNPNAKLNFISHSMGGAYAVGMINALSNVTYPPGSPNEGEKVFSSSDFGDAVFLAPYESESLTAPAATNNFQYSHLRDDLAGYHKMSGVPAQNFSLTNSGFSSHGISTFKPVFEKGGQSDKAKKAIPVGGEKHEEYYSKPSF